MSRRLFDLRLWLLAAWGAAIAAAPAGLAAQEAPDLSGFRVAAGPAAPASASVPALWASSTQSSGQRPIEVLRAGQGTQNVLIVGSLYGNEPESVALLDGVARLIRSNPPPEPLTILLVRTPNPDGLAEHIRTNARGVDLNRNFPSPQFTAAPNRLTGPQPASETETQFLIRVLQEYKPVRVVHVRSSIGERPLLTVNELWAAAGEPVLPAETNSSRFEGAYKVGSLEEYASRQLHSAVATVQLPPQGFPQLQPAELLRFATAYLTAVKPDAETVRQPVPAPMRPAPAARRDGERGMVEFLPPPPGTAPSVSAVPGAEQADSRYYELPPPPR